MRLGPYIASKRHADLALETAHLDPVTGFYNMQGLMHRMAEIKADTFRNRRPLACVVLGPRRLEPVPSEVHQAGSDRDGGSSAWDVTRILGDILLAATRLSDVVGRVGESDFVIVAPGADDEGAVLLAERIMRAVDEGVAREDALRGVDVRAGFHAVSGAGAEPVIPEELLRRATRALREAQEGQNGSRLLPFDPTTA